MNKKSTHKKFNNLGIVIGLGIIFLSGLSLFFLSHQTIIQTAHLPIPKPDRHLRPVVVLLPHQDDEMFLSGAIIRFIKSGRPVYTLLVTDGSGSVVRNTLNGGRNRDGSLAYSVVKKKYLIPKQEGYEPLDKQAFSTARNREYFESMQKLGVPIDHIHFANPGGILGSQSAVYRDGSLTSELATTAISQIYHEVGDGIYLAVASDADENTYRNIDHLAIEDALKNFPNITERYYFGNKEYPGETIYLNDTELKIKQQALESYKVWNPRSGRFAVGAHSVPDMLNFWHNSHIEYLLPDSHNLQNNLL